MDNEPDLISNAMESLDDVEVSALAMLGLGAIDDADSDRADQRETPVLEQQSRRRFEIHPLLGWGIVLVLSLALIILYRAI